MSTVHENEEGDDSDDEQPIRLQDTTDLDQSNMMADIASLVNSSSKDS